MKGKVLCSIEVSYNNCEIGCGICSSVMPAQIHTTAMSHGNIHILKANRALSGKTLFKNQGGYVFGHKRLEEYCKEMWSATEIQAPSL